MGVDGIVYEFDLAEWLRTRVYRDVDEFGGHGWWYVCPGGLRRFAWFRWSAVLRCLWAWRNEP